jgi:two-component system cell cycle response regulator DivK
MKVLVIEDNRDMRELLQRLVEVMHYIPICTNNGKEGFEKAALENPDVILMDFMMPGMDGFETTRLLRATPSTKDIPIIATTAMSRQSDIDACLKAGCNSYVIKPFSLVELGAKIRQLLVAEENEARVIA